MAVVVEEQDEDELVGLRDRRLVCRRDEVVARMADEDEAIVEDMFVRRMFSCTECGVFAFSKSIVDAFEHHHL